MPVTRVGNSSGALWHRLQFWRNFLSPWSSGSPWLAGVFPCCTVDVAAWFATAGDPGACADAIRGLHTIATSIAKHWLFIVSPAMLELEIDRQARSARYFHCPWKKAAGNNW